MFATDIGCSTALLDHDQGGELIQRTLCPAAAAATAHGGPPYLAARDLLCRRKIDGHASSTTGAIRISSLCFCSRITKKNQLAQGKNVRFGAGC